MAGGALGYGAGMMAATVLLLGLGLLAASRAGAPQRLALRVAGGAASVAALAVALV